MLETWGHQRQSGQSLSLSLSYPFAVEFVITLHLQNNFGTVLTGPNQRHRAHLRLYTETKHGDVSISLPNDFPESDARIFLVLHRSHTVLDMDRALQHMAIPMDSKEDAAGAAVGYGGDSVTVVAVHGTVTIRLNR